VVTILRWNVRNRWPLLAGGLTLAIVAVIVARNWMARPAAAETVATERVGRHDIAQSVDATGTVQAVEVVEIKSKASGQILQMPVAIGSVVKAGDLLAQIDPLTVRNQYAQMLAALQAVQANVSVTAAQKARAEELYSREAMTAADHESATLGSANALAALAKARSDLQIAKQSLNDATVRAPSAGTIIEQDATKGMVIASATSSASGGTTLFKIADLSRIQMQTLVGETDVGTLAPDMLARVTVDAFPNRPFPGHVVKIEPQAVVQQSVTMFPVLVAIENANGQLLPGMNGEVTIDIAERTQVVAVPLDAVRSLRELSSVATTLGLNADTLSAQVQRQMGAGAGRGTSAGDSAGVRRRGSGGGRAYGAGGGSGAGGGPGVGSGAGAAGASAGGGGRAGGGSAGRTGGGSGGRTGGGSGGGAASRAQIVMVQTLKGPVARVVRLGISDFDYAEVLSGLNEGETVVLLSVAEQAAKRKQQQAQLAQRVGTGLPGSGTAGGGGGGGGGRAGGGGR
jgi:HlyD family secretion protein